MEITLNIKDTEQGRALIQYIETLPFVEVKKDIPKIGEEDELEQEIIKLSKEVNRNMTKRLFRKHQITTYDSHYG